jgi:hypothetical protein
MKVCRLEKRNHPKNRDPMIVLDGQRFVLVILEILSSRPEFYAATGGSRRTVDRRAIGMAVMALRPETAN